VLTLLADLSAINAINMVEGIDRLFGGLSYVTIHAQCLIYLLYGQNILDMLCFIMISAKNTYLMFNIGMLGRSYKVFMVDE
ncbi:undecaprenyl-phosphate alpha-N-acetylglucosaminyl 1-phosphate transferase, partial [Erwinia amylovora]|nr:undecaprenyl-phosphate alpha-N-acetylglucosaminyl 1-phosphate transferase [Erwinia amylovora]